MPLTLGEKIQILLKRRNLTLTQLGERIGQSRQNMSNKMSRDNFTESEAKKIADALDCDFDAIFTMRDSGEQI